MQKLLDITFTGKTDVGLKRDHNEDAFVSTVLTDSSILLCCIDGVGGLEGGGVCAASVAVKTEKFLKEMQPCDNSADILKSVLVKVNNDILDIQKEFPEYSKMACVMTSILVDTSTKKVYMAHVGDTRLYEFADGQLVKLSHDHSPVGVREDMGILTEKEAMSHPKRNIIERCIGDIELKEDTDYIESATFPLKPGTTYLLCSDGLTDLVTVAGISQILAEQTDVDTKTNKLIAAANDAGGKDNITVLLLEIPDNRTEEEKLADSLVDNTSSQTIEESQIPDNEFEEAECSSQLLDEIKKETPEQTEDDSTDKSEADNKEPEYEKRNPESEDCKLTSHSQKGKNILLTLVSLVLVAIIAWMGWDIHTIKENQKKIMADTVFLRAVVDTTKIVQLNDTLTIDSVKFVLGGDSLHQNIPDSLKSDTLMTNH